MEQSPASAHFYLLFVLLRQFQPERCSVRGHISPGHPGARKASQGEELESVGGCEASGALRGDDPVVTGGQQLYYSEGLTSNITTPSFLVFKRPSLLRATNKFVAYLALVSSRIDEKVTEVPHLPCMLPV